MKTQSTIFKLELINKQIIAIINNKLAVINPLSFLSFARNINKAKTVRFGLLNVRFSPNENNEDLDFDKVYENSNINIFYYIGIRPLNNKCVSFDFIKNQIVVSNNLLHKYTHKYKFLPDVFDIPVIEAEIDGKKRRVLLDINGPYSYIRQSLLKTRLKPSGSGTDYFTDSDKFSIELYNLKFKLSSGGEIKTLFAKSNLSLDLYLDVHNCDAVLGLDLLLDLNKLGFAFNFKKREFLL